MKSPVFLDKGGYRKFGGIYEDKKIHLGYDYNVNEGSEVFAIANGKVLKIKEASGFGGWNPPLKGWYIWIQHDKICALYGHVKPFEIKEDDIVKEGQIIGFVHDYIRNKFHIPHLHFGIWNGLDYPIKNLGYDLTIKKFINPISYIKNQKQVEFYENLVKEKLKENEKFR